MSSNDTNRQPTGPRPPDSTPPGTTEQGDVDFGAFVSSRVKASADKLKGTPGATPPSTSRTPARSGTSSGAGGSARREPTSTPSDGSGDRDPQRAQRSSRYWRESAAADGGAGSGSRSSRQPASTPDGGDDNREAEGAGFGGFGGGIAGVQTWVRDNSEGRPWFLPALIGGGLLILLLVIWLLMQLGGGGGGNATPTPTQTPVSVIGVPGTTVEPTNQATMPTPTAPVVTPTEPVKTGGDNQRGEVTGSPSAQGAIWEQCGTQCLVRVNLPGDSPVFATLGTRPSFSSGEWSWVVAPPGTVSDLAAKATSITMVQPDAETLRLYAVTLPSDVSNDGTVREYGTIIDTAGNIRLLQTETAPGKVGSLADAGYAVDKLTPAPAQVAVRTNDMPKLASTDIGTLSPLISNTNLEQTIRDLQGMGSTDGSGIGSRYYSLPGNQMAAEYLFQKLESYGLRVWYEDFITPDGLLLVNVVGELPGADSSKIYATMAHFDTTSNPPGVSPGADDNATGVAATLEIARILSGYQLKYPVRIVMSNAEDSGLLGSDAWAKRAVKEKTPIEGVFNIDSVGSTRQGTALILNGDANSAWMMDLMKRVNDAYGLGNAVWPNQNPKINADDNYVRAQGIEAIMIARELYGQSPYHHTPNDIIDHVSIDQVSETTAVVLLSIASLVQQ